MNELETNVRREAPQVTPASKNPQEKAQVAASPLQQSQTRQETAAVSQGTVSASAVAREKPQGKAQAATPPLQQAQTQTQQETVAQTTASDSTIAREMPRKESQIEPRAEQAATRLPEDTPKRPESVASRGAETGSPTARAKPQKEQSAATQPESVLSEDAETDSTKTGALVHAARAIEEGAEIVGEKAPVVASIVIHKIKKGATAAYGTSSTLVRDAYHAASEYTDKYKHKIDIRKLKSQRQATTTSLGSIIYTKIVIDGEPPEQAIPGPEITSLLQKIYDLDQEIVKIGSELEN